MEDRNIQLEAEKQKELKEIKSDYNKLMDRYNAFQKKYTDTIVFTGRDTWFHNDLMKLVDGGLYGFRN